MIYEAPIMIQSDLTIKNIIADGKPREQTRKDMKMETIYLLPVADCDFLFNSSPEANERFAQTYRERMRMAATLDYVPDSLETLMAIEYQKGLQLNK